MPSSSRPAVLSAHPTYRLPAGWLLVLCLFVTACSRGESPEATQAALAPAQEPSPLPRLPHVESPAPARIQLSEPLVVVGRVQRPDGSPLERVQVVLFVTDATGQPIESLAQTDSKSDGSFELPGSEIPRVGRVRFRWQPLRQSQFFRLGDYVGNASMPLGPPLDVWLDRTEIADWTAISATVDTGWTLTGQVLSQTGRSNPIKLWVINTTDGRGVDLDSHARFAFLDIPWAIETCTLQVTEDGSPIGAVEVSRPPQGSREAFTEIVVP